MSASGTAEGQEPSTAKEIGRSGGLSEQQWANLLRVIDGKQCTPIIGAGASFPTIPLADKLAAAWSEQYAYPLKDSWNLSRVAQYLAVNRYGMFPQEEMRQEIAARGERKEPEFSRWFARLSDGVEALSKGVESHAERLILLQHSLIELINHLDPEGTHLPADKLLRA